ncbi:hypothetical protein F5884DRAFT_488125 [Xylogone sp. PMI_703]|nr:hypothetical protein F5884DRAFT_488125 [Xylogone sp. PMI_703]
MGESSKELDAEADLPNSIMDGDTTYHALYLCWNHSLLALLLQPQCQDQDDIYQYSPSSLSCRFEACGNATQQCAHQSGLAISSVQNSFPIQGFGYSSHFTSCLGSHHPEPAELANSPSSSNSQGSLKNLTGINSLTNMRQHIKANFEPVRKHGGLDSSSPFRNITHLSTPNDQSFQYSPQTFQWLSDDCSPFLLPHTVPEQSAIPHPNLDFPSDWESFLNNQFVANERPIAFDKNRPAAIQYQSICLGQQDSATSQMEHTVSCQSSVQQQTFQTLQSLSSWKSNASIRHPINYATPLTACQNGLTPPDIPYTPYTYHYGKCRKQERATPKICTKVCPKCNMFSWCASFQKHLQRFHNLSQKEAKVLFKATPITKIPNPDWKATRHSGDNSLRAMRECNLCGDLIFEHIFLIHLQKSHSNLIASEIIHAYESSSVIQLRERLYYKQKYEKRGKVIFLNGLRRCTACHDVVDERDFDLHKRRRHASLPGVRGDRIKVDLPLRARLEDVIKVVPCSKCQQVLLKNYDYHLRDVHGLPAALAHRMARSAKSFTVRRTARIDESYDDAAERL